MTTTVTARFTKSIRRAFVLRPEDLRKLVASFESFGKAPEVSAECRDGITRTFQGINQLLEYENTPSRAIQSVRLSSYLDFHHSASLKLSPGSFFNESVELSIEGPEPLVTSLQSSLNDRLQGMRPWYAWCATVNFITAFGPVLLLYVLAFGLIVSALDVKGSIGALGGFLSGTIPAGLTLGILFFRTRVFPLAVFAIGQGESRFENSEKLRLTVVVGFVVSVASGLVLLPLGLMLT